jgi:hypothetical protein
MSNNPGEKNLTRHCPKDDCNGTLRIIVGTTGKETRHPSCPECKNKWTFHYESGKEVGGDI